MEIPTRTEAEIAAEYAEEFVAQQRAKGYVAEDLMRVVENPLMDQLFMPSEVTALRERVTAWYAEPAENGGKGAERQKVRFRSEYDTDTV